MNTQPLKKIGIFSPSSWVEEEDINASVSFLQSHGVGTHIHPQTFARDNQSAGTHEAKLQAFYDLWYNPEISYIWAAGGGNRCLHWIDSIDYKRLDEAGAPKPVIGFSDVTALLCGLYAHKGYSGIHGPTFNRLHKNPQREHLLGLLRGESTHYDFPDATAINHGQAKGHLIGGNLSVFQYLPQTLPGSFWDGAILFLEDCNEELSRLDRMLLHLRRLGVLPSVAAILLGDFGDLPESGKPFGFTLNDIIQQHTQGLNIPILMDAPFGHGHNLFSFPIGAQAHIDISGNTNQLIIK